LQNATQNGERVLFLYAASPLVASEDLPLNATRTHPPGILPPNGAMVYGLNDATVTTRWPVPLIASLLIAGEARMFATAQWQHDIHQQSTFSRAGTR
jgi:hypothetical protein